MTASENYVLCSRCNEHECVCGDLAFEQWFAEEMEAQDRADAFTAFDSNVSLSLD